MFDGCFVKENDSGDSENEKKIFYLWDIKFEFSLDDDFNVENVFNDCIFTEDRFGNYDCEIDW